MNQNPILVQSDINGFNIVRYGGLFYAIKQSLGAVRLETLSEAEIQGYRGREEILTSSRLKGLKKKCRGHFSLEFFIDQFPIPKILQLARIRSFFLGPKISFLIPSMGRPERARDTASQFCSTAKEEAALEFLFFIDEDDEADYEQAFKGWKEPARVKILRRPKTRISGERYNILAREARGEILMYAADDVVMHTVGWDQVLRDTFSHFPDGVLLLGDAGTHIPLHAFFSRKSFLELGYVFPALFEYGYNDFWTRDLYQPLGRFLLLKDYVLEHRHWHSDPKLFDATYAKHVDEKTRANITEKRDEVIYLRSRQQLENDKERLAQKIKAQKIPAGRVFSICIPQNLLDGHQQITSRHPLFESYKFNSRFRWTTEAVPESRDCDKAVVSRLIADACSIAGGAYYKDSIGYLRAKQINRKVRPEPGRLLFMPTYLEYVGGQPWVAEIEDWTTLFYPEVLNGKSNGIDVFNLRIYPLVRALLRQENCMGVITHMRSTKRALDHLFPDLRQKFHYIVPSAIPSAGAQGEPVRRKRDQFLFINSFSAGHTSFLLRGGREIIQAGIRLRRTGKKFRIILRAKFDVSLLNDEEREFINSAYVEIHDRDVSDLQIKTWLRESTAILLPSARIHIMTLLQAAEAGCPIVCSDGWGFDEFVADGVNGRVVQGRAESAFEDGNGLLREDYASLLVPNEQVAHSLSGVMEEFLSDEETVRFYSRAAADISERYAMDRMIVACNNLFSNMELIGF